MQHAQKFGKVRPVVPKTCSHTDTHWSGRPTLSYPSYAMERRVAWKCSYGYQFHAHVWINL